MSRDRFTASMEKREAVNSADASGEVCDSMAVRAALMQRVHTGEITLLEAQAELQRIKREGKKAGKLTRSQVWSRS